MREKLLCIPVECNSFNIQVDFIPPHSSIVDLDGEIKKRNMFVLVKLRPVSTTCVPARIKL